MIKDIIIISVIMLFIDFIYLISVDNYFNKQIKLIQGSDLVIRNLGWLICYPFLVLGLYYFVIKNKNKNKNSSIFSLTRDAAI